MKDEPVVLHCYTTLADIEARLRVPSGGDRPTDPRWTEKRLVPLAPRTLERLEKIAPNVREHGGVSVEPMQLAALLLEKTTEDLRADEAEDLLRPKRRRSRTGGLPPANRQR